jgi:hypothetical protein
MLLKYTPCLVHMGRGIKPIIQHCESINKSGLNFLVEYSWFKKLAPLKIHNGCRPLHWDMFQDILTFPQVGDVSNDYD